MLVPNVTQHGVSHKRTGGKASEQVERGGCLVVGLHQPHRVGHARIQGELLPVDDVTPVLGIQSQLSAARSSEDRPDQASLFVSEM